MAKRQIVLVKLERNADGSNNGSGAMVPLGSPKQLVELLSHYNIAPDHSGASANGMLTLHGPGLIIEAPETDEVAQAMVTLQDEDYAWPVMTRMCRTEHLSMMDMETGRIFGG